MEHDLSWLTENPKIGYHTGVAMPVFLNRAAFWLCYSGSTHPEVVDMAEWEWDDTFETYFKKEVNEEMTQNGVKSHLKELVCEAAEIHEALKEDESIKIVVTPTCESPLDHLSVFNSKDSRDKVQKFIKEETKEGFLEQLKPLAEKAREELEVNPIQRDEYGAIKQDLNPFMAAEKILSDHDKGCSQVPQAFTTSGINEVDTYDADGKLAQEDEKTP